MVILSRFHPLLAYTHQTGEALAGELRPGNAGANTAADQIAVAEQAIEQSPSSTFRASRFSCASITPALATKLWTAVAKPDPLLGRL